MYQLEYTTLTEDEAGYVQAINYATLGVAENGTPDLFTSEDTAVRLFKDWLWDQAGWLGAGPEARELVRVEDNPNYVGWGVVIDAVYADAAGQETTDRYSLRIEEADEDEDEE